MASAFLAEGAHVPVAVTAVRAELSHSGGAPGAAGPGPGVPVPALLLRAGGGAVGAEAGDAGEVDLRALPGEVARVLFPVPAAVRVPGLVLRLLRAADATELASLPLPPDAPFEGGELRRTGGLWVFHATAPQGPRAPGGRPGTPSPGAAGAPWPGAGRPPSAAVAEEEARVPSQGPAPGWEGLAPPVHRRLALRREQAAVSLLKYGAADAVARVVLVLDASASMAGLYASGAVADVVERTAAVAALLGEGRMAAWTFASHPARLPDCVVGGLPQWLRLHVRAGQLALLGRPRRRTRGLDPEQIDMRCVGVRNEEHKAIAQVRAYVRERPVPVPTLVVFLSGGGVHRDAEIERQLAEAADEPLFWQFVGLDRTADYGALARAGQPAGGGVGNAGFFAVDDVTRTSDAELYDRLLCAFPGWLASARRAGVLD